MKRVFISLIFFAALTAIWQILVSSKAVSPVLIPSPLSVLEYLYAALSDGTLIPAAAVTARRLLLGYAIGVGAGLPLGFITSRFQTAADALGTLALGLQTLPSVCWVPLSLLWFGQSEGAILFVVIMGTVWAIMLATDGAIRKIPPVYARAARTMGSRRFHTMIYVIFPAALPDILGGMKQGWAFAWRSLMAAEIYVTIISGFGLGHLLHYGRELHAMDQVIGVMLIIILVGLAADMLLFAPAERFLHRRFGTAVR